MNEKIHNRRWKKRNQKIKLGTEDLQLIHLCCHVWHEMLKNPRILFYFIGRATLGIWYLSSPSRDQTCASCIGSRVLTTGPPGKFPKNFKFEPELPDHYKDLLYLSK